MAYVSNDIIRTLEISTFNNAINELRGDINSGSVGITPGGLGYGQLNATDTVLVGDLITAQNWTKFLQSVSQVAQHQGTINSLPASVTQGNIINIINNISSTINALSTNRFNIAPANLTTTSNGTRLTSMRNTRWDGEIYHVYNASFSSWNAMRYFFNSGGRIINRPTYSGGSTGADAVWNTFVNNIGSVFLDYNVFYSLTSAFSTISTVSSGSEQIRYRARLNAEPGSATFIQIELRASSPIDGNQLTGTLTNLVDDGRSTGVFVIPAPSYATTTNLSEGGQAELPISNVVISGGGVDSCEFTSSGCSVTFTLTASVTNGTGNFEYVWTLSDQGNYSIVSGQGTPTLTITSASGTVNLPTATVGVTVNDLGMVPISGSDSTTIKANKVNVYPPFTGFTIGGSATTQTCRWDYDSSTNPSSCSNSWTLTATPSGGSGSFSYSWSINTNWAAPATTSVYNITSPVSTVSAESATVSLTLTDTELSTSHTQTINLISQHQPGPITAVYISTDNPNGSCDYPSASSTCNASASYLINLPRNGTTSGVRGGSGNFNAIATKTAGNAGISSAITGGYLIPIGIQINSSNPAGTFPYGYTITVTDNSSFAAAPTSNTVNISGSFLHEVRDEVSLDNIISNLSAAVAATEMQQFVQATITCNFTTNGSVIQVEGNSLGPGTTYNRTWHNDAPQEGIGNDYEIFIDDSNLILSGGFTADDITILNSAPDYTPITDTRGISIRTATVGGGAQSEPTVDGYIVVHIRRIGTTTVYSKTINIICTAVPI